MSIKVSIKDWLRGRRDDQRPVINEPIDERGERVDEDSGEIIEEEIRRTTRRVPRGEGRGEPPVTPRDMIEESVAGERTIPSVNRERSMQSRISSALAVGAMLLLGIGFLFWYYSTQFSKAKEAREAQAKATEARATGEMRLPPLGRVDPPSREVTVSAATPVAASDILGAPPPPPPQAAQIPGGQPDGTGGPPQKTPEQLALERRLGMPVLLNASMSGGGGSAPAAPAGVASPGPAIPPNIQAMLGGLTGGGPGAATQGDAGAGASAGLASNLKPTPTPAVAAQVVPTRRYLLPKGAFVDCTLETAIDSTYDGMVTCIGANDVYSSDGKVVLIERGTKYVGEKRGELKQGQGRVFVLWSEARTPTGVVVNLDSPGTDELGRTGLPGYVDTHFWDRFGSAILISVVDGALQAVAAGQQSGGGTSIQLNAQGTRDVMTEILRSTVNIPPTVIKNQGDRIQVLVARDVDFRSVYALRTFSTQ
jgi:type IV secretion system protein VirB10